MQAQPIALLDGQRVEFLERTNELQTKHAGAIAPTDQTNGIEHDARGLDPARSFASELIHEAFWGKPVLVCSGAPEHGLEGLHLDRSGVARRTCPALVSEFAARNDFGWRVRRAKVIHRIASRVWADRLQKSFSR